MSIDVMKQALEALELSKPKLTENTFRYVAHDHAIAALRAAIEQEKPWVKTYAGGRPNYTTPEEQPEQEPVVWMNPSWINPDTRGWANDSFESIEIEGWIPLYTAPSRQEWVGLTDEEKHQLNDALNLQGRFPIIDAIEAKLKERNK